MTGMFYRYETTAPEGWYSSRLLTGVSYGSSTGWDYGCVRIPAEAGQTVGHFGLSIRSDDELTDLPIEVVGYPSGTFAPIAGHMLRVDENTLRHSAPSASGHSGSPLFDAVGYVVAVHNSHTENSDHIVVCSTGARVRQEMIDEMRGRGFLK